MNDRHNIFKRISVVPNGDDLIYAVLSSPNPKFDLDNGCPNAVVRHSYIQKVKNTQSYFLNKLSKVTDDFPRSPSLHPFYAELLRDDGDLYNLALDEIAAAKTLIADISRDYVKILNYADAEARYSLIHRCKTLQLRAVGNMCSVMKRISWSLTYLEGIRRKMTAAGSLPSLIDPMTPTVFTCGCSGPGKNSFLFKSTITWPPLPADDRHFETLHLSVGHTDHRGVRWQVVNTPGMIEMSDVHAAALSRLHADVVLFFLDYSDQCCYSIAEQAAMFRRTRSVLADKAMVIVCCNKTRLPFQPLEGISEGDRKLVVEMALCGWESVEDGRGGGEGVLLVVDKFTEESVMSVNDIACRAMVYRRHQPERTVNGLAAGGGGGGRPLDYDFNIDADIWRRLKELEEEEEEEEEEGGGGGGGGGGVACEGRMGRQISRL